MTRNRPALAGDPAVTVKVALPVDIYEDIRSIARDQTLPTGTFIRTIVMDYLRRTNLKRDTA